MTPPLLPALRRHAPRLAFWLTLTAALGTVRAEERSFAGPLSAAPELAEQVVSLTLGLGLAVLAFGLRRRKRRAYRATVLLLLVRGGLDIALARPAGLAYLALLGLLLLLRPEFHGQADPRGWRRALLVLAGMTAASTVLGFEVVTRSAAGSPGVDERFGTVLLGLVGMSGPVALAGTRAADRVYASLLALGVVSLATALCLALRPVRGEHPLDTEDEHRVRALLGEHGAGDSLGYFSLRRDKSLVWSPTGKSAVAYRVVGGVMLASGDPLGDAEAWPGAVRAFLDRAHRYDWVPAALGVSGRGATAYARAGLSVLEMGDEAILDTATFTLAGRCMRTVRQAVARVERGGYTASVRRTGDVPSDELRRLAARVVDWRVGTDERGFSMALSRLGDPADASCVLALAVRDGEPVGLLHFVPWGPDGLSLDLCAASGPARTA